MTPIIIFHLICFYIFKKGPQFGLFTCLTSLTRWRRVGLFGDCFWDKRAFRDIQLHSAHTNAFPGACRLSLPCCKAPPADWLWGNGACSHRFLSAAWQSPPCPSQVHPAWLAPRNSPKTRKKKHKTLWRTAFTANCFFTQTKGEGLKCTQIKLKAHIVQINIHPLIHPKAFPTLLLKINMSTKGLLMKTTAVGFMLQKRWTVYVPGSQFGSQTEANRDSVFSRGDCKQSYCSKLQICQRTNSCCPYTNTWFLAMSTRSQARVRTNWSKGDEFVPAVKEGRSCKYRHIWVILQLRLIPILIKLDNNILIKQPKQCYFPFQQFNLECI